MQYIAAAKAAGDYKTNPNTVPIATDNNHTKDTSTSDIALLINPPRNAADSNMKAKAA